MPQPMRTWGFAQWGAWGRPSGRTTGQNETPAQRAQRERELADRLISGILGGTSSAIQREQERAREEQRQRAELELERLREQGRTERARMDADRPQVTPQFQVAPGGATTPTTSGGITTTQAVVGVGALAVGGYLLFGRRRGR